ncbi:PREDICTED: F-box protein SKIP24 isoform X1 [Theobroma cacao]|uniref:F-box protein SKIP24 isoform X1 n=1 Tax=Theobroma cacao TaxID=3641 RepID=A0AB32WDC2_THECC|nr:PREDICTED: F-box protein SKIP24 isoform X1 [Theobroma cacao]
MSSKNELPDELWRKILEIGIKSSNFIFKDLCSISISCRRLHRLSNEDSLWSHLLSVDFPNQISSPPSSSSPKSLYKIRFERERERKLLVYKRAVLRKESQVSEHLRKLREIEVRLSEEREKLKSAVSELSNLHKVSQASVALNVWQPEVVRGRQKQTVEQCVVPVESRIHALEMEVKLCNQQLQVFDKAYRDENRRLDVAKEELQSMKYHPLRDYKLTSNESHENKMKRKKLKTCINFNVLTAPDKQGKTT